MSQDRIERMERMERLDRMERGFDSDSEPRPQRSRHPVFTDPDYRVDYKDVELLRQFVTERGKLIPRRLTGLTARRQREVALAIRRARMIALMPYGATST